MDMVLFEWNVVEGLELAQRPQEGGTPYCLLQN